MTITELRLRHWACLHLTLSSIPNGVQFVMTTNNPCHLWCRYTGIEPVKYMWVIRARGVETRCVPRIKLKDCLEAEQEELGDTTTHTFNITPWLVCQTKWFYFKGTVGGKKSNSTSPIFKYHLKEVPVPWMELVLQEKWTWSIPSPTLTLVLQEPWTGIPESVFESYTAGPYGAVAIYGNNWAAQSFTPHQAHKITAWLMYGSKNRRNLSGQPPWPVPPLYVGIRLTDGAGKPTGGDLVTGIANPTDWCGYPDVAWQTITFDLPYQLNLAVRYAAVVRCPAGDGTHYVMWYYGNVSPGYPDGQYLSSVNGGSTWTPTTRDMMFQEKGYV